MWKKLLEIVRDVFDLRQQVKAQGKRLDELASQTSALSAENRSLAERVMRLELKNEHLEKQQVMERENFRLQLELLIVRTQRGLPPRAADTPTEEEKQ